MTGEWLTEGQVAGVPEGTVVWVKWSGGNGPHRYRLQRDPWGRVGVVGPGDAWQLLGAVGDAPGTQVWVEAR